MASAVCQNTPAIGSLRVLSSACYRLHLPACEQTLTKHKLNGSRHAKEAVHGQCCVPEHTCYWIAAGPVISLLLPPFACM
jgi:hypothetical protein